MYTYMISPKKSLYLVLFSNILLSQMQLPREQVKMKYYMNGNTIHDNDSVYL
jgi:hypothetical protein